MMTETQTKILGLEEELAKAKAVQDKFEALTEAQKLATLLHEKFCNWNHTDGCGWFYSEKWDEYSRKRYLEKADNILAVSTYENAVAIVECL